MNGKGLRAGTTLVELMVSVTLFAILLTITVQMSAPLNEIGIKLWRRARNVNELRTAVEYIRQDVGVADSVTAAGDHAVIVAREPESLPLIHPGASGADPGILYHVDADTLMRNDLLLDEEVVIARNVTAFDVNADGTRVEIAVATGTGDGRRDVHLVWQP